MNTEEIKKSLSNMVDGTSIVLICIQVFLGFKVSVSEDPHGFMIGLFSLISIALILGLIVKAIFDIKYRIKFWLYLGIIFLTIVIVRSTWSNNQEKYNIEREY